MLIGHRLQ